LRCSPSPTQRRRSPSFSFPLPTCVHTHCGLVLSLLFFFLCVSVFVLSLLCFLDYVSAASGQPTGTAAHQSKRRLSALSALAIPAFAGSWRRPMASGPNGVDRSQRKQQRTRTMECAAVLCGAAMSDPQLPPLHLAEAAATAAVTPQLQYSIITPIQATFYRACLG
jgi:uncharacterized iron-regulated membrane protein